MNYHLSYIYKRMFVISQKRQRFDMILDNNNIKTIICPYNVTHRLNSSRYTKLSLIGFLFKYGIFK